MATSDELTTRSAAEVLRDTDRDSVGVVRILNSSAGKPGEEREYKAGDEALVEHGLAEWVVAPVHLPSAGRRLDHDAESEPTPLDGAEAYPPAEPTTGARRAHARDKGWVDAHTDGGFAEKLGAARTKAARSAADSDGDAKLAAELGGLGARSGPVTARSELPADRQLAEQTSGDVDAPARERSATPKAADKK